ncbi:MAG: bifunctional (p)ppGpp synthetase/guanosine-3',5'-bis(diphosphate) 3'-pyrophosphohydrolase [Lachnospiraceae bacterium]|nr:bifunctional (p)ppGpp synthetase/guanosine-3',5'-bis(diphosphate) 3'-pyrophosphohydrolase [Lachnospiraceae bacterium]
MAELTQEEKKELELNKELDHRRIIPTEDFADPEELYKELIARIRKYHPSTDISQIEKAYKLASGAHEGQVRRSGEPYIIHPLCVAIILADLELDKETIIAGILHDVVEDTVFTVDEIAQEFSEEVAELVDGVTKLEMLSYDTDKVDAQAENLRKMFLAMAKDIRVLMIKLADRLHNMRTLRFMTPEKQKEKARETQEIYAPLAQRLGISKIKIELDDLALKYLEPEAYYDLVNKIALRKKERDERVAELENEVGNKIREAGIHATIEGRAKHFFSIYKKMVNQDKTLDQIYDLFAVRIIVDNVRDCYASLGVIHESYTPVPGRFKDYIAMPKSNMYQSLHTTVIGPDGTPFEIQIRTYEMHRTSEYGIAAHWKYKESGEGSTVNQEEAKLSWLRQILEWQQDMSDNREFVGLLKNDLNLFSDTVFCFTPTGDVKNLPNGSTPIDFAYSIHSAVGNRMVGAKVNGRLVPIDYVIQNGDRIDIITSQNSKGPSLDWLKIVKSTQAKNKINQWFRQQVKEENIVKGKELLQVACKTHSINYADINIPKYQAVVMRRYGFHDWDACLATVGHGGLKEGLVVNRMYEEYRKDHPIIATDEDVLREVGDFHETGDKRHPRSKSGIRVKGAYDLPVHFSRCCNPVPGDEIIGFITRGRGVSIHRTDCINVMSMPDIEKERMIEAEWEDDFLAGKQSELYQTTIRLFCANRKGLLVDISKVFTEKDIDISSINTHTNKQGVITVEVAFGIRNKDELRSLVSKLMQVENVMDIDRAAG